MAADVLLSIGIDPSEALRGRDSFISASNDIANQYERLIKLAKEFAGQGFGGASPITPQVRPPNLRPVIDEYDRAAAAVMAGEQRKAQAAQKAAAEQERAVSRLTGAYAPHVAELQRLAKDEAHINELRAAGAINTNVATQALAALHARQQFVTAESERMAKGARLNAYEMRNLSYQLNDVVSGLAMGQSPFMILTQQGGQFVQIAQAAGISLGRIALGVGAVGLAGAALIAPLVHLANMRQEARELDIALRAVGNTTAGMGAQLQALSFQTAANGMSGRDEVLSSFRSASTSPITRALNPSDIQRLTQAAEGYAFVTGKTLPQATDALIKVLAGGYVEMTKLSETFPLATARELEQLRVMAEHGDRAGMLAKEIELLNRKFGTLATEGASQTQKALHALGTAWDEIWDGISKSPAYLRVLEGVEKFGKFLQDAERLRKSGNVLSMPMPPLSSGPGQQEQGKSSAAPSLADAATERANAIMAAARQEAAAYQLVGVARERAQVSAQFDRQIAEAQGDAAKAAELLAQKRAALLLVDARARGQAKESADTMMLEAAAQQRLADAVGKGYEARMAAERQNKIDAERRTNPFANPGAAIDAGQSAALNLAQKSYLYDLEQSAANENRLTEARLKGAEALRRETLEIEVQKRSRDSGFDADKVRSALEAESLAKQRAEFSQRAISSSATLSAQQQANDIDLVIAKMRELGATEEEIAQVYKSAEIAKLEATQNWADGAQAALMRYNQSAADYGQMAGNAVSSSMRSMENALVGFSSKTMTAAQAFKSMVVSIIQDLIRLQVRAQITGPLSAGLSNVFSGGTWGTSQPAAAQAVGADINSAGMGEFATGTEYAPRGWAIVGEKGPELMQLGGGERIYPADETSAILNPRAANSNARGGGNVIQITNYVEGGASMADVEAAVMSGIREAAPHIVNAAVQQSVPASLGAVQAAANRGGSFAQAVGRRA